MFYLKYLLTLSLIISVGKLFSQNYQSYYSHVEIAYDITNEYGGTFMFQRVDSTSVENGDSLLFFYANYNYNSTNGCYTPYGDNWMGKQLRIQPNGDNLYLNKYNDTISIYTQADVDSTWLAYSNTDQYLIYLTVTTHDTVSFLELTDSVKTFSFSVYDPDSNETAHVLQDLEIRISKNHGLITTMDFLNFPNINENIDIKGLSDPENGIQNLQWFGVHGGFEAGDIMHIKEEVSEVGYSSDKKIIHTFLECEYYQDSIIFTIERKIEHTTNNAGDIQYNFHHDTIKTKIVDWEDFNFIPMEPNISNGESHYNVQNYSPLMNRSAKTPTTNEIFGQDSTSCWEEFGQDACPSYTSYYEGLRGPYYYCSMSIYSNHRQLIYYKKGEEEWGTPFSLSSIEKQQLISIKLFPNPAVNSFRVNYSGNSPLQLEVYEISGRVVMAEDIHASGQEIDTTSLPNGLYLCRVYKNSKPIHTEKLLISK